LYKQNCMDEWKDFFVVTAGAAATLTGLIFVGISISLAKILSIPTLPNRAFISLVLLLAILVVSVLFIVPGQPYNLLGAEALLLGAIVWITVFVMDIAILRSKQSQFKRLYVLNMVLNQISVLPYIAAGAAIWVNGVSGLYWLVPAMVFSFIKAVLDAWVLLVEINR
jgi:hypothetical protein